MILEKITEPTSHLKCGDLTANQKKFLYEVMARYDGKPSFAYERFFDKGFREWELRGIDAIKKDFLAEHERELWTEEDDDGEVGYPAVLAFIEEGEHSFYDVIGKARLKSVFTDYMYELGMSGTTVLNRFGKAQGADFKAYERVGIRAIVTEFEREMEEKGIA